MGVAEASNQFMAGAPSPLTVRGCAAFGAVGEVFFPASPRETWLAIIGNNIIEGGQPVRRG